MGAPDGPVCHRLTHHAAHGDSLGPFATLTIKTIAMSLTAYLPDAAAAAAAAAMNL